MLPRIRELAVDPNIWSGDTVRMEMAKRFGYPVTESSGHGSEYTPWWRKRPELIEPFCPNRPPQRRRRLTWTALLPMAPWSFKMLTAPDPFAVRPALPCSAVSCRAARAPTAIVPTCSRRLHRRFAESHLPHQEPGYNNQSYPRPGEIEVELIRQRHTPSSHRQP